MLNVVLSQHLHLVSYIIVFKCFVLTLVSFNVKFRKKTTLKTLFLTIECGLRTPGQRLPSQSKLITYRIA